MTPTTLDSKPQGAQLKLLNWVEAFKEQIFFDGTGCRMNFTLLISDLAEAAERIEKLELELHNTREAAKAAATLNEHEARRLVHERDTALRALAEARRDRDAAHKVIWALAKQAGGEVSVGYSSMLEMPLHPTLETYHDKESHRNVYRAIDAVRQPEKDANNG